MSVRQTASRLLKRAGDIALAAMGTIAMRGATCWHRSGPKTRIAVGSAVTSVVFLGVQTVVLVGALNDARSSVNDLIDSAASVSPPSLLEPGFYHALSTESIEAERAVRSLESRMRWLKPLEFVPVLGGKLGGARRLVGLARNLASGSAVVLECYGAALDERRAAGRDAVVASLDGRREALEEVRSSLGRAARDAQRPLPLSDPEVLLLQTAIGVVHTLAAFGAEESDLANEFFDVLEMANRLRKYADNPFEAIIGSSDVTAAVADFNRKTGDLSAYIERMEEANPDLDAFTHVHRLVSVVRSLGAAAASLVSVVNAVDLGVFSPAFGSDAGRHLEAAAAAVREAQNDFDELLVTAFGAKRDGTPNLASDVPNALTSARRSLRELAEPVEAIRTALGYDGEARYLVVMQNQNEIRATGGFIGAVIEFPLTDGVLGNIVFDDSLFVDVPPLVNNPPAPEPLYWYLWSSRMLFRDANWSPHFPASARTLLDLYIRKRPVKLVGVISATKALALDLVGVLGTVKMPGLPEAVDRGQADRYIEGELEYPCSENHVSLEGKRCFDEDLIPTLLDGLRSNLTAPRRELLFSVLRSRLARKDVMVFSTDDRIQELIVGRGWSGEVPASAQDFLMIVDSALPGHSAATTTRTTDYRIALDPRGGSSATLRVRYHNTAPRTSSFTCRQAGDGGGACYWDYVRIFLPPAAERIEQPTVALHEGMEKLIWGYRDLDSGKQLVHADPGLAGLTEVGGYFVVEPGELVVVPMSYELTPSVLRDVGDGQYEYALTLVRQSGLAGDFVAVRIDLPGNAIDIVASPADANVTGPAVTWYAESPSDTRIAVRFSVP